MELIAQFVSGLSIGFLLYRFAMRYQIKPSAQSVAKPL